MLRNWLRLLGLLGLGSLWINSFDNIGGFVGPHAMGAISKRTASFHAGLVFCGRIVIRIGIGQKNGTAGGGRAATAQPSAAVMPTPDIK